MAIWFKRSKPGNNILRVFRITDMPFARSFDGVSLIEFVAKRIEQVTGQAPTRYSANYQRKDWKTLDGFARNARKFRELTLAIATHEHKLALVYVNSLVGFIDPPAAGSIEMMISRPDGSMSFDDLAVLAQDIYGELPFDYGYVHRMDSDCDPQTERKRKRTIFGSIVSETRKEDSVWLYHMMGVRHGCIKSIYPLNILNGSHLSNPTLSRLVSEGVGKIRALNDHLSLWSLTPAEMSGALLALAKSGSVIGHDEGRDDFLRSPGAAEYYEAMWPAPKLSK
jgi:hypothetical protein